VNGEKGPGKTKCVLKEEEEEEQEWRESVNQEQDSYLLLPFFPLFLRL